MTVNFSIIATFSRMCDDPRKIRDLILAGTTGFRFSFSKDNPAYHFEKATQVQRIAKDMNKKIDVIMDLPGLKPRIVNDEYIQIEKDTTYRFSSKPAKNTFLVKQFQTITGIRKDEVISTGDGELAFRVTSVGDNQFEAKALVDGLLTRNRGIVIQGRNGKTRYLTRGEKEILKMNAERSMVFTKIWYSFADSAKSILEVTDYCRSINANYTHSVVPKVETRAAIMNLRDIHTACEEVLIGRGDLALDCGALDFYTYQMRAINACRRGGCRVIIGTQLFETTKVNWFPYRAEVSDFCHLLECGIDGILLEAETVGARNSNRCLELIKGLVRKHGMDKNDYTW